MPNAILRVGPFASETDSFLDQPDPINVNGLGAGIVPVNCASAFPFRTNISRLPSGASSFDTEIQLKESGSELAHASNTGQEASHLLFVSFRYQAAIDFNIKLNFVASVVADSARVLFVIQKGMGVVGQVNTLYRKNVSGSSLNVDLNEDFVIFLTASVKPQFVGFSLNCTVFGSPDPVNLTSSASLILKPN